MTCNDNKGHSPKISTQSTASNTQQIDRMRPQLTFLRKNDGETHFKAVGAIAIITGALLIALPIIVLFFSI